MTSCNNPKDNVSNNIINSENNSNQAIDDLNNTTDNSEYAISLLQSSVEKLENADSFKVNYKSITSYSIIENGTLIKNIYGEFDEVGYFNKKEEIIGYAYTNYRYNKDDDFINLRTYYFEENNTFFIKEEPEDKKLITTQITLEEMIPYKYDGINTIIKYGTQANLIAENNEELVFHLIHPKWYESNGLSSFADLGFLILQEDNTVIEDYVEEHYSNIIPPEFTVYISKEDGLISKIEEDNSAFMSSILDYHNNLVENKMEYIIEKETKSTLEIYNYNINEIIEIPN